VYPIGSLPARIRYFPQPSHFWSAIPSMMISVFAPGVLYIFIEFRKIPAPPNLIYLSIKLDEPRLPPRPVVSLSPKQDRFPSGPLNLIFSENSPISFLWPVPTRGLQPPIFSPSSLFQGPEAGNLSQFEPSRFSINIESVFQISNHRIF